MLHRNIIPIVLQELACTLLVRIRLWVRQLKLYSPNHFIFHPWGVILFIHHIHVNGDSYSSVFFHSLGGSGKINSWINFYTFNSSLCNIIAAVLWSCSVLGLWSVYVQICETIKALWLLQNIIKLFYIKANGSSFYCIFVCMTFSPCP